MSALDLSSLSAVELSAALTAGRVDLVSLVAHLSTRRIGETIADLVPLLPLLGEYTAAVMLAQQSLHQKPQTGSKLAPVRRSQGSRNITVHPPTQDEGKKQWALTAGRAAWRWIVQHAAEIEAACADADKVETAIVAKELAEKMKREAERAAK